MDGQTLKNLQDFSSRSNLTSIYNIADTIANETEIDFSGLSDAEKLALFVYQYDNDDMVVFARTIANYFGWSRYKIRKLRNQINKNPNCNYYIDISPCFSEEDGLIAGNGYQIDIFTHKKSEW